MGYTMNYKKLIKGITALHNNYKLDVATLKEAVKVVMDSCSINNQADRALLKELSPLALQAKELMSVTKELLREQKEKELQELVARIDQVKAELEVIKSKKE
jgi:hypothetical protein